MLSVYARDYQYAYNLFKTMGRPDGPVSIEVGRLHLTISAFKETRYMGLRVVLPLYGEGATSSVVGHSSVTAFKHLPIVGDPGAEYLLALGLSNGRLMIGGNVVAFDDENRDYTGIDLMTRIILNNGIDQDGDPVMHADAIGWHHIRTFKDQEAVQVQRCIGYARRATWSKAVRLGSRVSPHLVLDADFLRDALEPLADADAWTVTTTEYGSTGQYVIHGAIGKVAYCARIAPAPIGNRATINNYLRFMGAQVDSKE